MTGWGQEGPLAPRAGTTLTTSLSGILNAIGAAARRRCRAELIGDFARRRHAARFGVVCALLEAQLRARQVIDAAMVDGGAARRDCSPASRAAAGPRSARTSSTAALLYESTNAMEVVAIGAIEDKFYASSARLQLGDLHRARWPRWPEMRGASPRRSRRRARRMVPRVRRLRMPASRVLSWSKPHARAQPRRAAYADLPRCRSGARAALLAHRPAARVRRERAKAGATPWRWGFAAMTSPVKARRRFL